MKNAESRRGERVEKGIFLKSGEYFIRKYQPDRWEGPYKSIEAARAARNSKPVKPTKKSKSRGIKIEKGIYFDEKTGIYSARLYQKGKDGKQKEINLRFRTKEEARRARFQKTGAYTTVPLTVGEMVEMARDHHRKRNPERIDGPMRYLDTIEGHFGKDYLVPRIGDLGIESFRDFLDEKPSFYGTGFLAEGTKRKFLMQLSQCFRLALDAKRIREIPKFRHYQDRKKGVPCDIDWPIFWRVMNSVEQNKDDRLYLHLKTVRAMMVYILYLGPRLGDVLRARWSDIEGEYITFRSTKTNRKFKRQLPTGLKNELDGLEKVSEFMFSNPKTKKPFTDIYFYLDKMAKDAGVNVKVRPHKTRHLCADGIYHLSQGKLKVVKDWVGWENNQMAEYYLTERNNKDLGHKLDRLVRLAQDGDIKNPWDQIQDDPIKLLEKVVKVLPMGTCDYSQIATIAERIAIMARACSDKGNPDPCDLIPFKVAAG